jgi:hypothetical protein
MPTFDNTGKIAALFIFNHIITRFVVPRAIVNDHDSHFQNVMMSELTEKLGLRHKNSTPYYPQVNGQVEEINKVLTTMLPLMVGIHNSNWHTMLFSELWAYRTSIKSATGFTPFQLVYGIEAILSIECEIPSFKLVVELLPNTSTEEEHLLYLMQLEETCRDVALVIETQKNHAKSQYDKHVKPRVFSKSVFVQDQNIKNVKLIASCTKASRMFLAITSDFPCYSMEQSTDGCRYAHCVALIMPRELIHHGIRDTCMVSPSRFWSMASRSAATTPSTTPLSPRL